MGKLIRRMGIPTFAVSALLLVVLIAAYVMGQSLPVLFTDILRRVGMNGILVLAMVPSIKSGVGPNFALPIGIVGGLFALMCCMQMDLMGWSLIGCSILLAIIICGLMGWAYGKLMNAVKGAEMTIATKTGLAIYAGGVNPKFAEADGLKIDRSRVIANIISTVLAGIGIIIYSQGYGYAQIYNGPLNMAFPAVAAVLIGGATATKASCVNVVVGVCIFQGLMTASMPVSNALFTGTDLSDIMRQVIQNGVILYALTQVKKGGDR